METGQYDFFKIKRKSLKWQSYSKIPLKKHHPGSAPDPHSTSSSQMIKQSDLLF